MTNIIYKRKFIMSMWFQKVRVYNDRTNIGTSMSLHIDLEEKGGEGHIRNGTSHLKPQS